MYPVNQVILGGDPMMGSIDEIDLQIKRMEAYRKKLAQMTPDKMQPVSVLWNNIDAELAPLSEEQKNRLFMDEKYVETYAKLQAIVQSELLNLVKDKIEHSPEGKSLLEDQLKIVKVLKTKIIEDTNREMELFKHFKEFSKHNPGVTYEDFLKSNG